MLKKCLGFLLNNNYSIKCPLRCRDLRTEGNIYLKNDVRRIKWHNTETYICFKDFASNLQSHN